MKMNVFNEEQAGPDPIIISCKVLGILVRFREVIASGEKGSRQAMDIMSCFIATHFVVSPSKVIPLVHPISEKVFVCAL